jgi:AGZA family xanthine/uracil permease-like MFS transporter
MWTSFVAVLDRYFLLTERGTTVGTEFRAGTASFLTLSYLLLVNPQIMMQAGVPRDDAVLATALSATVSCFIIGFCGNLPFGCAPGLGLSAYLTFGLVQADLCTLPEALSACWWSGIFVFVISLSGGAAWLMRTVPESIKYAIVVGMGLLVSFSPRVKGRTLCRDLSHCTPCLLQPDRHDRSRQCWHYSGQRKDDCGAR